MKSIRGSLYKTLHVRRSVDKFVGDSVWISVERTVMSSVRNPVYSSVTISQYQIEDGINEEY
jgi:hypothetical protein